MIILAFCIFDHFYLAKSICSQCSFKMKTNFIIAKTFSLFRVIFFNFSSRYPMSAAFTCNLLPKNCDPKCLFQIFKIIKIPFLNVWLFDFRSMDRITMEMVRSKATKAAVMEDESALDVPRIKVIEFY